MSDIETSLSLQDSRLTSYLGKGKACAVCSGELVTDVVTPAGVSYLRCLSCQSLQRKDDATSQEIEGWYDQRYRPDCGRYVRPFGLLRSLLWRRIARHLDAIAPHGIIVDVGAGEGDLARELRRRGRACVPIDPYSRFRHVGRQHLQDAHFEGSVGCLVYWHSFEHVVDPQLEVAAMAALLDHGGKLVLAVPNPCSLQAAMLKGGWLGLDKGRHLNIPSRQGLTSLLMANGFGVDGNGWQGGDAWQGFVGWLDALLRLTRTSAGAVELVLASSEQRRRGRLAGFCMTACLFPAAAGLSLLERVIGRPGSTVFVARRLRAKARITVRDTQAYDVV